MTSNINVLVLGSDGFIGKHLLKGLSYNSVGLTGLDVQDTDKLSSELEKKPHVIVNCCGSFSNRIEPDFDANLTLTTKILETVKMSIVEHQDYSPALYLIGSAAEYGASDGLIAEDYVCAPKSIYGISKYLQFQLAELYRKQGLNINYLRLFNLYGKGISESLLIGRLYKLIESNNKEFDFGGLGQKRDYLHVSSFVNVVEKLINNNTQNLTVNIGSGEAVVVRDMVIKILSDERVENYQLNEELEINDKNSGTVVADISYLLTEIGSYE